MNLLLVLEGDPVHLPAPKSHFWRDIVLDRDTPIFGTSKQEFAFVRGGVVDEREIEMMKVRWRIFHLNRQIRLEDERKVPPCGKCFARFVLIESASLSGGEEDGLTPFEKHCARNRSKNFLALGIKLRRFTSVWKVFNNSEFFLFLLMCM